ncbi:MAG TPA: polyhydroxyalkanoic acid system family protein [Isosphaeraceae bacterium]|nr:polyhydroxyalkanoic acid system family protein [Isosphaeraceae bacterium]
MVVRQRFGYDPGNEPEVLSGDAHGIPRDFDPLRPQQPTTDPMALINLSVKHGRTLEEARSRLEMAVNEVRGTFGAMVQRAEWSTDRNKVRIDGAGFWVEMTVDEQHVHATGDLPFLGNLLGGPLAGGLKQIVEKTFQKKLP